MSTRGLGVVQRFSNQSADLGRLEGVLIRCSDLASCILSCSDMFGGEGCKKNDGTGAYSLSRFP